MIEQDLLERLDALPWGVPEDGQLPGLQGAAKGQFLRTFRSSLSRCMAPGMSCAEPAILAHTVQNARGLELLQRDGHVKAFKQNLDGDGKLVVSIDDIGRNRATTFQGFCSRHDTELFLPIDTLSLASPSDEQLFLLAYRAVVRELHAQMTGAMQLQKAYQDGVQAGRFPRDTPSDAGLLAVRHMLIAHQGYQYKFHLDKALLHRKYASLQHRVFKISHAAPSVAAASCFTVPHWARGVARVTLNLLPISTSESLAIFSYVSIHTEAARSMLGQIFDSQGFLQKYLLSKLILARCENMVIAPDTFARWSEEKVEAIELFFQRTVADYFEIEDQRLYLFQD